MATDLTSGAQETEQAVSSFTTALGKTAEAIDTFARAGTKTSDVLGSVRTALDQGSSAVSGFLDSFQKIAGVGTDLFTPSFNIAISLNKILGEAFDASFKLVQGYDAMDSGLREFAGNQYKLAAGIGATFEESERFATSYRDIIKTNSDLARSGLYIGSQDVKDAIGVMQKAGVEIGVLAETTKIFGVEMTYAQGMAAQAKAMGMDISTYSTKIAAMVRTNGMSMEESMKFMASSQDIARNTGLTVDEVTGSLDKATSGFAKMGMTMDFGRPILKGFADSIKDVGLGIAQAGDLAAAFTASLGNIINNPALAYITSMKGGMAGMGGGGILNPSIQMQASMLDNDPSSKAKMAKELSDGMRDTLKSFTGGDIITVKQAAESPELQTKFYTQQQMLGSTYGISGADTQNRVLEYLAQLEDATYAGDEKSAELLQKQISDALQGNDKTMSLQEKMGLQIEKGVMIAQEQLQTAKIALAGTMAGAGVGNQWKEMLKIMDKLESPETSEKDKDALLQDYIAKTSDMAREAASGTPKIITGTAATADADQTSGTENISGQATKSEITVYLRADPGYAVEIEPSKASVAPGQPRVVPIKR
jgi:hypothetical protein